MISTLLFPGKSRFLTVRNVGWEILSANILFAASGPFAPVEVQNRPRGYGSSLGGVEEEGLGLPQRYFV